MADTTYSKGLEGVIAAESTICQIDGTNGRLYYRGYPIEELAQHSNFEETTYLLLSEELPSREELDDIGSPQNIRSWLDRTLGAHEKVMGMGHRVYKTTDPRATIMEQLLQELFDEKNAPQLYDFLKQIEEESRIRMEGKPLYPNVDFYSGAVYTLLGIPRYLFRPIFAAARSPGWLAHILEQRKDNKLVRPKSLYVGPEPRAYVPIDERAEAMSPAGT